MTPDRATGGSRAAEVNKAIYDAMPAGQADYWRLMAAPRFRMATFIGLLRESSPGSLIDLGCGNGQLLAEIWERWPHADLAGMDMSEPQIEANRDSLPGIEWYAADLERPHAVPAGLEGRFDTVVASEIIEHLDDPAGFLANGLALAAPGTGRLLLSTQSGPVRETERRVGHRRHYEREEMEALLRRTGWEPVRIWNSGFPFHDLSKWWANRDPDATMRRFGDRPYGRRERAVCLLLRLVFRLNSAKRGAQLFAVARRR